MPDWITADDLLEHLNLPSTPAPSGPMAARLRDAVEAAVELIEDRTAELDWAPDDVPRVVRQAGLMQAARLFKRSEAPFGIAAVNTADGGQGMRLLARLDPDVDVLLDDYLREYGTL